jgi:hypothetical protein
MIAEGAGHGRPRRVRGGGESGDDAWRGGLEDPRFELIQYAPQTPTVDTLRER